MNPKIIIVYSITVAAGIAAVIIPPGQAAGQQNNQSNNTVQIPPGQTTSQQQPGQVIIPSGQNIDEQPSGQVIVPPGDAAVPQPPGQVMIANITESAIPSNATVSTSDNALPVEVTNESNIGTQALESDPNQQVLSLKYGIDNADTGETFVSDTNIYDPYGGAQVPCPDTGLPAPPYPLPPPAYPAVDSSMPYGPSGPTFGPPPQVDSLPLIPPPPPPPYQPDFGPPPQVMPAYGSPAQIDSLPYGPDSSPVFIPPEIPPAFPPAIAPFGDDCEEVLPGIPPPPSFGAPPLLQADSLPYGPPPTGPYPPMIPPPFGPDVAGDDCEEDLAPLYNQAIPPPSPYAADGFEDCEEDFPAFDTYQHDMDTMPTDAPTGTAAMDTYTTALSTSTPEIGMDTYDSDLPSESLPSAAMDSVPASSETQIASKIEISSSKSTVIHSMILMFGIVLIFA